MRVFARLLPSIIAWAPSSHSHLAQRRYRCLGQRIEGAPATLAAIPQQPVRPAPADDLAARAMGTTLTLHPLDAGRSKRVLCPLAPVFVEGSASAAAFASAAKTSSRCAPLIAEIANTQSEKSSDFIELLPRSDPP